MVAKLRSYRLSHTAVVAYLALFVALGGTGYAAATINGKNIKNRTVAGKKLKKNTVTGAQINESTLAEVPNAADAEHATTAGTANAANVAGDANTAKTAKTATTAKTVGGFAFKSFHARPQLSPGQLDLSTPLLDVNGLTVTYECLFGYTSPLLKVTTSVAHSVFTSNWVRGVNVFADGDSDFNSNESQTIDLPAAGEGTFHYRTPAGAIVSASFGGASDPPAPTTCGVVVGSAIYN